jgi:hypothetical protein
MLGIPVRALQTICCVAFFLGAGRKLKFMNMIHEPPPGAATIDFL